MTLKLGINIYPTYLDGGSQPHLNRVVIQKVPATTLACRAGEAGRDYDADDVVHRSCEGEGRGLI
jgi:hypothetical protein